MEITIGQVAGIIAAAVFIVQFLFPNAVVLVLVCLIGNQHSAVTWSVVGRQINNSQWPILLRSDTSASRGVYSRVIAMAYLRPIGAALIAVAAVVTPLGLHDAILPDNTLQSVPFTYLQDRSPLGYGTPPQGSDIWFSRSCGGFLGSSSCPGSSNVYRNVTDEYGLVNDTELIGGTYDITIAQHIKDLYTGGRARFGATVSSFFDIRARQYTYSGDPRKNNGKPWPVDTFRMLESRILEEKVFPVDGLVVDMVNGGLGFRNHTIPHGISQGADWTEDLLWLEPMTECVDTNLTLEFTLPDGGIWDSFSVENVSIIDNGGFTNLAHDYPGLSMDDNQRYPQLRERAYKAAWLVNAYSMLTMNITRPWPNSFAYLNSELGQKFPLATGSSPSAPGAIRMDTMFNTLVSSTNVISSFNSSFSNTTTTTGLYDNPFDIGLSNYSDISLLCQGSGQADYANSSNLQVQCGLFYAAVVRADGKETLLNEPNTTWHQSVFTCASLNKVSIKNVAFRYNATLGTGLTSLSILNITDKQYAQEADMPLWAIEQPQDPVRIADINQFWGLVADEFDPADAVKNNISLKRAPEIYLPGYTWGTGLVAKMQGFEYIPASSIPKQVLASSYDIGGSSAPAAIDYSGATSLAMFQRWRELSQHISTVPDILKLVWTDLAMNSLQGARGWNDEVQLMKRGGESDGGTVLVPVLVYRKRIQYRWMYAIPAFVALGLFGLLAVASIVFSTVRQGPARVRYYLNQLSAGRLLAVQHHPGHCEKGAPTKTWIDSVGTLVVDITQGPVTGGVTSAPEHKPLIYNVNGKSENVNNSTIEVTIHGDAYPTIPLHAKGHEDYVTIGQHGA